MLNYVQPDPCRLLDIIEGTLITYKKKHECFRKSSIGYLFCTGSICEQIQAMPRTHRNDGGNKHPHVLLFTVFKTLLDHPRAIYVGVLILCSALSGSRRVVFNFREHRATLNRDRNPRGTCFDLRA